MNKLEKWILKKYGTRFVLQKYERFEVVEYKTPFFNKDIVCIEDESRGWYSAIYKNDKYKTQPFLEIIQRIVIEWNSLFEMKNALILGCAGCSIPRFLAFTMPSCNVVGVEKSSIMIEIANKYFSIEKYSNFILVHQDVFYYISQGITPNYMTDFILVDLSEGKPLQKKTLSSWFLGKLYEMTNANGLVIINHAKLNDIDIKAIAKHSVQSFNTHYILNNRGQYYSVLVKSKNIEVTLQFKKIINHHFKLYQ